MYNFKGFTQKANDALNLAIDFAGETGHTYIGTEHLLLGLVKEGTGVAWAVLTGCGLDADALAEQIKSSIGTGNRISLSPDDFTPRTKRVMQAAVIASSRIGHNFVGTEHLLIAILAERDSYALRFMENLGVNPSEVMTALRQSLGEVQETSGAAVEGMPANSKNSKSKTKNIDQYSKDLTALAKEGGIDPVIGREQEIQRVVQILSRRTKNNPVLIGEPGVGKTAVAEGLALKIAEGQVPETLRDKRIVSLNLTGMIAGTKYRGDFEERIKGVTGRYPVHRRAPYHCGRRLSRGLCRCGKYSEALPCQG